MCHRVAFLQLGKWRFSEDSSSSSPLANVRFMAPPTTAAPADAFYNLNVCLFSSCLLWIRQNI